MAKRKIAKKKSAAKKGAKKVPTTKKAPSKKTATKGAGKKPPVKKKAAKVETEIYNLSAMRGVPSFDLDEMALLVRSTCSRVAEAFKKRHKLKTWIRDAVGITATISGSSYFVYQLKGHAWVIINGFCGSYVPYEDARALSKSLATRAIYFGNSDAACATQYDLYENGKQLEHFEDFEGVKFRSLCRDVEPPVDGPDIYPFVDAFIKEQDAFIPGWSSLLFEGRRYREGDKVKLDFDGALNEKILDGFDFLSE